MNKKATPFDEPAFVALYSIHGEKAQALAVDLSRMHKTVLHALGSIDEKYARIQSIIEPFAAFGLDVARDYPETRAAVESIASQDENIQSMGATSMAKGVGALDLIMRGAGASLENCQSTTHQAFTLLLDSLPERVRVNWDPYFEKVGLVLATASADGSIAPKAGAIRI